MHVTSHNVFVIVAWAVVACAVTWLVTTPVRRMSLSGALASVVLTGTAASIGAVLGSVRVMVLPAHAQTTVLVVAGSAGVVGALAAAGAARAFTNDRRELSKAVADLGAGRVPVSSGRRLTAELESVRTELSHTAERLAASRAREQALEEARRELVAWVSHDLRTPLAGLRAMSEALEDGVVDDPDLYYKQIRASVDRLSGMVDDLFDLSRIQAGAFARDLDVIALDDLVSDCIAALEPLAAAEGVTLSGRSSGTAMVRGNGAELNRAVTNVIANAVRHTRVGGSVTATVGASGAHRIAIDVTDECGGIDPADLPRVFDVGFRGEPARTPQIAHPPGAGLGLAIARGILEAHGGSIAVANIPGGCRFTLALPVLDDAR